MRRQLEREREEERQYNEGRKATARHREFQNYRSQLIHRERPEVAVARKETTEAAGDARQQTAIARLAQTRGKCEYTAKVKPTINEAKVFVTSREENTHSLQDINVYTSR